MTEFLWCLIVVSFAAPFVSGWWMRRRARCSWIDFDGQMRREAARRDHEPLDGT